MFCLKSDIKIFKLQKPVRNIPKNNVIKDNRTVFLNAINKVLSAYAKKSRIAIMLHDLFHDLLSCSERLSLIQNNNFSKYTI